MKRRSGLLSAIISFFSSLVLLQFHKIPTTNLNPLRPTSIWYQTNFLFLSFHKKFTSKFFFTVPWTVTLLFMVTIPRKAHFGVCFRPVQNSIRVSPKALDVWLSPGSTGKISQQLDSRFDLHKPVLGAGTVPVTEDQCFRPRFLSDLSLIRAV